MKKFCCALAAAALVFSVAGISACGKTPARTRYEIEGEFVPEENKLIAEMTVTVPNLTENALDSLSFELWPNAYRRESKHSPLSSRYASSIYYAGSDFGGIEISEVEGCKTFEVRGEDMNILSVALAEPLFPDETAQLKISFETQLAKANHRLGVGIRNVNLANFYPILCSYGEGGFLEYEYSANGDPFVSECADYEVSLSFPEQYSAAYGGVGETTAAEGKKTVHMTAENVRDVAFVLGEKLQCLSENANGVDIEYWYTLDPSPETTLGAAKSSLAYFSETFGDYAYPKYVVVETDFPFGGMEYPCLSMISSGLAREDVPAVVAHETAHQWWYAMVGSNQYEHAWQDEGLAEYSSALFLEAYPAYGDSYAQFLGRSESSYRSFFSVLSQITKEANTKMDRPLSGFSGEYEYRNIAYDKGVILFDRVREVAGDKKFFAGLKRYAADYAGKIASPADLISSFRKAGANVGALFSSFTEGLCVI